MTEPEMARGSLIAGRYRLDRHLGEGGMGTVWAATHVVTRREVAMKFLRSEIQHKQDVRQRFLREAQAVSALRHPNVVEVIDVFELPDQSPVIVMELLEGETLGEKLVRDERLSVEETAAVMLPVLSAVRGAHAMGIVHRDLKPENIFLCRSNGGLSVKVLDFGIAKITRELHERPSQPGLVTESGSLLGTPCYMAPEQITNSNVDHRSDIWSLGVILYECLSGTRPVEGENTAEVIARLMSEAITPLERLAPELPHEVTGIVRQMLSRDQKRRLQDLGELSKVLGRYTPGGPASLDALPAAPASPVPQAPSVPPVSSPSPASPAPPVETGSVRSSTLSSPATPGSKPVRRSTMMSAPAVGIDRASHGPETPPAGVPVPASRSRLIVGLSALLVLGLISLGVRSFQSGSTAASPGAASRSAITAGGAPEPIKAQTEVATMAKETPAAPSASASTSADSTSKAPARHPHTPATAVRVATPKTTATPGEDTLFSGRK